MQYSSHHDIPHDTTASATPSSRLGLRVLALAVTAALTACATPTPSTPGSSAPAGMARLTQVAAFDHQVTGVTVSETGRIFVNFPRWSEDSPVSVAEVMPDGSTRPYPDTGWNAWRNAKADEMTANDHWVCVQSVVADKRGALWVLDPGAPAQGMVVKGAAKLVKIDLATNTVVRTVAFDEIIAPQGSYLNDVRFSPDGGFAYITDSGARGSLVVVNLQDGSSRRVLDGHPSTQVEKGVAIKTDGQVLRRPDGRGVAFSADGIALSVDGSFLYWQAIKGNTLYRIPTAALKDSAMPMASVAQRVEKVGINGPSDGLLIDRQGRMYLSAIEDNAVKVREGSAVTTLVADPRLRWPDTFSEGPDGAIYVTSSRIMDMSWYKPGASDRLPTTLFRIDR